MVASETSHDQFRLPDIGHELARTGLKLRFRDPILEARYQRERQEGARVSNRVTLCLLTAIFDVFLLGEIKAAPEVVVLSAWLRFAVLTPAVAVFVVLDQRRLLDRWRNSLVTGLVIAPTLISGIESHFVTSPAVLSTYQATPLLQLAVLTCRMGILQASIANGAACLIYFLIVFTVPFIPASMVPSLLLMDVSIAVATLVFTLQIGLSGRQVFLLGLQADLGRDLLAAQNLILTKLTQIDALTGLGNRRCFDETLAALWSDTASRSSSVALVLFDIDCFKLFNDTYGHQAGDECLAILARAISRCRRDEDDTLVRYGGEEFAIILPHTSLKDGCAVAERVRQSVFDRAVPHPDAGPTPYVTVSLGVATVTPALHSAAVLIEAADRCLYAAKRNGRNQVVAQGETANTPQPPEIAALLPPIVPSSSTLL